MTETTRLRDALLRDIQWGRITHESAVAPRLDALIAAVRAEERAAFDKSARIWSETVDGLNAELAAVRAETLAGSGVAALAKDAARLSHGPVLHQVSPESASLVSVRASVEADTVAWMVEVRDFLASLAALAATPPTPEPSFVSDGATWNGPDPSTTPASPALTAERCEECGAPPDSILHTDPREFDHHPFTPERCGCGHDRSTHTCDMPCNCKGFTPEPPR